MLEAVVAMVVIGSAGMALFTWINASVSSLQRIEAANDQSSAMANAIEFMHTVNPMSRPQGSFDLGAYSLQWNASPLGPALEGADYPAGVGDFQAGLFTTEVRVLRQGAPWFDFQLKQVGHKRVRTRINPLAP